jgi:hypothetical protein
MRSEYKFAHELYFHFKSFGFTSAELFVDYERDAMSEVPKSAGVY